MARLRPFALLAPFVALLLSPLHASAQAPLISGLGGNAGYGPNGQCLGRNDDGSSAGIDITPYFPNGLRFFDRTHTRVYVNTNGNITFNGPVSTYTPRSFPVADQPMIAPFWGDVDIRWNGSSCDNTNGRTCSPCGTCSNQTENGVWWYGEPGRMIFTWDEVGYYDCEVDKKNSFQLILTAVEGCGGEGDFDVEFRYNRCEWEAGSASGGSNGLCTRSGCTPAQAGFDAGNLMDYVAIPGSLTPGIHTRLCTMSNVGEPGIWRFQIRSGAVQCPDAGQECNTGLLGVCATGRTNCVGSGTECVQEVSASEERCDALDNDCDGLVDEDPESLCPPGQVCQDGTCRTTCFEGGCPAGQVCIDGVRCVDEGCEDVSCPEGQRCQAGACVDACTGVICPAGQSCRAGLCVDLCEGLTCDDCTVCKAGTCAPRCQFTSCPAGETCTEDGRCIENACVGVTCPTGTYCQGGNCVDACEGAVCPTGTECQLGQCVPAGMPEPPRRDAGPAPGHDGGWSGNVDGGNIGDIDAGTGPGSGGPGGSVSCACSSAIGADRPAGAALLSLLALVAALIVRRRVR